MFRFLLSASATLITSFLISSAWAGYPLQNFPVALNDIEVVQGDFDGDGHTDYVWGKPNEVYGCSNVGHIGISYGNTNDSWEVEPPTFWTRNTSGMLGGGSACGDYFGAALTVGDFNGDGYDDLAVGTPGDDVSSFNDAGSVNIIYGSSGGLTLTGDQLFHQDTSGIEGAAEVSDSYGEFLAAGDFDCDGYDDLAVGIPREDLDGFSNAGMVNIIYGSSSGLTATGDAAIHQGTAGVPGGNEATDEFGAGLAVGNFNGDYVLMLVGPSGACMDLAIGAPGEDLTVYSNTGAVFVLYGNYTNGLTGTGSQMWSQANSGGSNGTNERFGHWLLVEDRDADGYDDLSMITANDAACESSKFGRYTLHGRSSGLSTLTSSTACEDDTWDDPIEAKWACGCFNSNIVCDCECGWFSCYGCTSDAYSPDGFGQCTGCAANGWACTNINGGDGIRCSGSSC